MNPRLRVGTGLVVAWLLACGPSDRQPPNSTGTGTSSASTSDTDGNTGVVSCEGGKALCDGECVNLEGDNQNCGSCGHACSPTAVIGNCREAVCIPRWHCVLPSEGLQNCTEVCARDGVTCARHRPELDYWPAGLYRLFYGDDAVQGCMQGDAGNTPIEAACDDPFDWTITGGFNGDPPVAASCLCEQL